MEAHREAAQRELNPDNHHDSFDTYNRDDYNYNDYSDTNNHSTDNYNDSYDAYNNSTDYYGDSSHDTTYNDDYQSSYDTSFDSYETPKKRINVVRTDSNNTVAETFRQLFRVIFSLQQDYWHCILPRIRRPQYWDISLSVLVY